MKMVRRREKSSGTEGEEENGARALKRVLREGNKKEGERKKE